MLSGGDPMAGEAGYVASEVVRGSHDGREGAFLLQQLGSMHAVTCSCATRSSRAPAPVRNR